MAELATYTATQAAGDKHKFTIDRNASRLLLKRVSSLNLIQGILEGSPERLSASIRTHSNQVEEVIRLQARLAHVAAYSSMINKEALYELVVSDPTFFNSKGIDTTGADNTNVYVDYFYINLTAKDGDDVFAVGVTSDDDFTLLVEEMLGGATYTLCAIEEPRTGSNMLEYTSINNIAGQKQRKIDVDHLDALVLPAINAIKTLKLQYGVGEPVEYTIEELKLINAQAHINDIYQYTGPGIVPTTVSPLVSEVLVLMTHNVVSVELTTDGTEFEFTQVRERARSAQ